MFLRLVFALLLISGNLFSQNQNQKADLDAQSESALWYIKKLNLPRKTEFNAKPVLVAVVDDGIRPTHRVLKDFIFTNPEEIPNNIRDDDNNGFRDDITGWDFTDNDNDVSISKESSAQLWHGTYIAGIIVNVFKAYFGEESTKYLQILPIKVMSDDSKRNEITEGYKGIKYADVLNSDIICCSWSGGKIKSEDEDILRKALQNNRIILSSAGNFFSNEIGPPASYPGVHCIAGVDSNFVKTELSNFSSIVELSAPAENVFAPHSDADNAFVSERGTSAANAIITGCVAILKSLFPDSANDLIFEALKNTAIPLDSINRTYSGRLGAGFPDMTKAIQYLTDSKFRKNYFNPQLPKGIINHEMKSDIAEFDINPIGDYVGINILPLEYDKKAKINIQKNDSIIFSGKITDLKRGIFVSGNNAKIALLNPKEAGDFKIEYYVQPIDSTVLYCKDVIYINQSEGEISDGSGEFDYANSSVCKWIITVPDSLRVRIEVTELDSQTNVDFLYIFDGNSALPENMLAKFSGQILPPIITSFTNQVMLWFLTDKTNTGKGWKLRFYSVK